MVRVGAVALIIGAAGLSMNAGASAESTPSANELAPVDIVAVSGLLDDVVVAEIETAIGRSTTNGAQAIVLQVNSRGAVVSRERMAQVLEKISSAAIPVAVWVGPTGARAYGLSAQMLTVADVTAMAPGAPSTASVPATSGSGGACRAPMIRPSKAPIAACWSARGIAPGPRRGMPTELDVPRRLAMPDSPL